MSDMRRSFSLTFAVFIVCDRELDTYSALFTICMYLSVRVFECIYIYIYMLISVSQAHRATS